MVNITINEKELQVEEGKTILEVAQDEGIEIPTLCHHKELSSYGACRLCLVEITGGGKPGLVVSCLYKVTDGLIIKTNTERVMKSRKIIIELLLARSPSSKIIQKLAQEYNVGKPRFQPENKEECILCGLCARVCSEVVGRSAISFAKRGFERRVQTPFEKINEVCIGCGACAYLCPTNIIKIESAD